MEKAQAAKAECRTRVQGTRCEVQDEGAGKHEKGAGCNSWVQGTGSPVHTTDSSAFSLLAGPAGLPLPSPPAAEEPLLLPIPPQHASPPPHPPQPQ